MIITSLKKTCRNCDFADLGVETEGAENLVYCKHAHVCADWKFCDDYLWENTHDKTKEE